MTRQIEGLWIGGAISVEAAEVVQELIEECVREGRFSVKVRNELTNLECAIRAQCQKVPEPPKQNWMNLL